MAFEYVSTGRWAYHSHHYIRTQFQLYCHKIISMKRQAILISDVPSVFVLIHVCWLPLSNQQLINLICWQTEKWNQSGSKECARLLLFFSRHLMFLRVLILVWVIPIYDKQNKLDFPINCLKLYVNWFFFLCRWVAKRRKPHISDEVFLYTSICIFSVIF